ncbi:hypothetical protein ACFV2D_22455, partial [Streptomyces capillispiralis]|uniref:hypothetical protein n=1 Tax=Streptomyces capillispiralis TaxID=68182 RepID=UPI003675CE71
TPSPYDNVGSQDHNQVLGADVTHRPEFANSIPPETGPSGICHEVPVHVVVNRKHNRLHLGGAAGSCTAPWGARR